MESIGQQLELVRTAELQFGCEQCDDLAQYWLHRLKLLMMMTSVMVVVTVVVMVVLVLVESVIVALDAHIHHSTAVPDLHLART